MTPLTCHLHVGMHKTGTSSVQETLFKGPAAPCRYLSLGGANQSGKFVTLFEGEPWRHRSNRQVGRSRSDVRAFRQELERRLDHRMTDAAGDPAVTSVLFSGERLSAPRRGVAEALGRLRHSFGRWCDDFRVHGYVRAPVSFMESALQQRLKMSALDDVDNPGHLWPGYRERFERFDTLFGADRVRLCKYAPEHLVQGDVVQDLAAHAGVDLSGTPVVRSNQALSLEAVALLHVIRRTGRTADEAPGGRHLTGQLVTLMTPLGNRRLRMARALVEPLLDRHGADIAWMEARLGLSLAEPRRDAEGAIGTAGDLLEAAAAARPLLARLEDVLAAAPVHDADGQALSVARLRTWVEEGLVCGTAAR